MLPQVEAIPGVPLPRQAVATADAQPLSGGAGFEALLGAALAAEPAETAATAAVPAEDAAAGLLPSLPSADPADPTADRVAVDLQPSPVALPDALDASSERGPVAPQADWPVPRLGRPTLEAVPLRPPSSTPVEGDAASSPDASEGAPPPPEPLPPPAPAAANRPTHLPAVLRRATETKTSQDGEFLPETCSARPARPAASSEMGSEPERGLPPSDAQEPTETSRSPAAPAATIDPAPVTAALEPSPPAATETARFLQAGETSDRLVGLPLTVSEATRRTPALTPPGGASVANGDPDHHALDPTTDVFRGSAADDPGADASDEPPTPPGRSGDEPVIAGGAKSSRGTDFVPGAGTEGAGLNVALPAGGPGAINTLPLATATLFPAPTDPSAPTVLQAARAPDRPVIPPALQLAPIVITLSALDQGAATRLTLTLEPEELGRIEVAVERTGEARLAITVVADRPETLHLLQRDSALLDRALAQAGVGAEGRSLAFAFGGSGGRGDDRPGRPSSREEPAGDAAAEAAQPTPVRTLLDLAV